MQAKTGLNAGLFIGRNNIIIGPQRLVVPESLIKIQHALRLDFKVRVARENPTAVLPRPDGVLIQPTPDGSAADAGHQTPAGDFLNQIPTTVTGQREAVLMG